MIKWGNWNLERKENEIRLSSKAISSIKEKVKLKRKKLIQTLSGAFEQEDKQENGCEENYDFSVNQAKKVVNAWNDSLSILSQLKEWDELSSQDTQELLNPLNKDGVVNFYSKIDDEVIDCHFLKFWKKLKRNVFTLTKDKINKILNDERVEFTNKNEDEMLEYWDSLKLQNFKGFFYFSKISAANWFKRQVLYDKRNKTI